MTLNHDLTTLWDAVTPGDARFDPATLCGLPDAARRYLCHAITPGTPLATAVRLKMRGEINLRGWQAFRAEQVIHAVRGLIWDATVFARPALVIGCDRFLDGAGSLNWKLLGVIPVLQADGPDISRSSAGRFLAESVLLPSRLLSKDVTWTANDGERTRYAFAPFGYGGTVELTVGPDGGLAALTTDRWGDPNHGPFQLVPFGGLAEKEATFHGYTIPTRLRIGWNPGTDGFATDGEFIRIEIESATFR